LLIKKILFWISFIPCVILIILMAIIESILKWVMFGMVIVNDKLHIRLTKWEDWCFQNKNKKREVDDGCA